MKEACIAGFGEVMLRLCPAGKSRFAQVLPGTLEATFGGGEANVCASVAMLGGSSRYLTALPNHPIARAFTAQMAGLGVDVSHIHFDTVGRMGVYFAEHGSNMRGTNVLYDRDGAMISLLGPEAYDFVAMLTGVSHLHLTAITPALTKNAYASTLAIAKQAVQMGITVSVDLNYRKKLWNWEEGTKKNVLAGRCMAEIVALADIIIGNEEDAADVFGIHAAGTSVEGGKLNIAAYQDVATQLSSRFPRARFVAITLRESFSADYNKWGGMLYDCGGQQAHWAPVDASGRYAPYEIGAIVDRFGGGDSFCAGLLVALAEMPPSEAIRFAVAASALKHTIRGDFNYSSRPEVEALMGGSTSGRVKR